MRQRRRAGFVDVCEDFGGAKPDSEAVVGTEFERKTRKARMKFS